jgi:lysophospholipase L1-like esterase
MLRRLTSVVLATLAVPATVLGLLTTPASATAGVKAHGYGDTSSYYLALGDSLAYGYQPTQVTGQGYVDQLYAKLHAENSRLSLTNLGCPSETTGTILHGGICTYPGQQSQLDAALAFLREHRSRVSLITLDIGANDVNPCVTDTGVDQACFAQGLATIASNTPQIVSQLRAAAPHAKIVAMTYYDPVLASWLAGPDGQALAQQSVALMGVVNGMLTSVFRSAGFRIADVSAAFSTNDLTTLVPLPGVGDVPLAVARICQWTWMCVPAPLGPDIHANQDGYGVIADTFQAAL